MVDITKEELWNMGYETDIKKKTYKTKGVNKIMLIAITMFITLLMANLILIYTFFNILNKI